MIPCLKNIYFITNLPRFQKKGEKKKKKKVLWGLQGGMKLSLAGNFFLGGTVTFGPTLPGTFIRCVTEKLRVDCHVKLHSKKFSLVHLVGTLFPMTDFP